MDIKKAKVGDLAKLAKLMKASGKKKSSKDAIKKADKTSAKLKKSMSNLQKLEKEDPDF